MKKLIWILALTLFLALLLTACAEKPRMIQPVPRRAARSPHGCGYCAGS